MRNLHLYVILAGLFVVGPRFVNLLHAQADEEVVSVMSYNIHRGGVVMLKQPLSQTAKVIRSAKADIVGIQETRSPRGDKLVELAKLLGWNHDMGNGSNILTRYKIIKSLVNGIKVELDSGREAYVFNLHLPSHPYQPYQLLGIRPKWHKHKFDIEFIKTETEAIKWAKKARGREVTKLLRNIRSISDKQASVFVVGDFNEPSHLDWTARAAKAGRHPIKVEYPHSLAMTKAGFADAYRTIYSNEMENPGYTWSSFYKFDDPTTHHDRIDFVYFKGKGIRLNEVKIVGETRKDADIVISPYPSDHRAVVADFRLTK
ncbi:MAG TPA: endonuclease/exonuclease/phosphatase family protein [Verrucomicrobiales bacterium]|nr:endonuclease/exonuclease/phosphatase family protein [Verrucomicrobiales bacterium]